MTPQRAGQLITAFDLIEKLKETLVSGSETNGFYLPQRETHVRPLAQLKTPEQRAHVWLQVIENAGGHGITAKDLAHERAWGSY